MPIALDRRIRRDAVLRHIGMGDFLANEFPGLVARHGALVARGIEAFDVPPLAIEIGAGSWSFSGDGTTLTVARGIADGALIVTFSDGEFSGWVQNQRSFHAMVTARELRYRDGGERDISVWDSLWLTLLEGWPVVDDSIEFLDRRDVDTAGPATTAPSHPRHQRVVVRCEEPTEVEGCSVPSHHHHP